MNIDITSWLPLIFLLGLGVLVFFINRQYQLGATWIATIRKLAPFWLVFFPAILTYFFICGALSATMVLVYTSIRGKAHFDPDEFLFYEKLVEYACSFFVPLLYFRTLHKHHFPFFWLPVIACIHALVAGYRDAKFLVLPPGTNGEPSFQSGPQILENIQWLDAAIPLLSLGVFLFFVVRRN